MEPDRPSPDTQALRRRQARNNLLFLVVLAAIAVAIFTFILWRTAEAGEPQGPHDDICRCMEIPLASA